MRRSRRAAPRLAARLAALLAAGATLACTASQQPEPAPDSASATTAAAAAAAADTGAAPAFALRGDFAGPLGVQLYSFRDAFRDDVPGTLARVRALGFEEVELAGTYGLAPERFREELDRAGLRATAMHVGYERLRDSLPAVLAEARALGVRWVGTAWIPHPAGAFTAAVARQAAADLNRAGRAARAEGVRVYYHIHGYEFRPGPGGELPMDVLMRETDPEAVQFEMDVFWAARPGADPAALLRQYPDRWALMHLKDMRRGTPTDDHSGSAPPDETEVPVGSGQIDYRAVLQAAKEIRLERYYIEDETSDPFATIPTSTRWLETVRFTP